MDLDPIRFLLLNPTAIGEDFYQKGSSTKQILGYNVVRNKSYTPYLLPILLFLFAGCASGTIDLSKTKVVPQGESVVFGWVNVILGGNPVVNWGKVSVPIYSGKIFVLSNATSKAVAYNLSGDGTFYWHLPSGDYSIAAIEFAARGGNVNVPIFADFQITQDKPIIYIGKLTLVYGGLRAHIDVEDHFSQEIEKFKNKFPEIKGEPVKNLMKLEKRR